MSAMLALAGRNALVTGGGRGLGRVMALALVKAGARVVITGARVFAEAQQTADDANAASHGSCIPMLGDVSDADACARLVADAVAALGPIDILVNNAARGPAEQASAAASAGKPRFWESEPDAYLRMLATNIGGPYLMSRLVTPAMIEAGWGRIINISTSRPTMLIPGSGPYGPAKAALEASTRIWARELDGTGVTVNALLPGGAADTALIPGAVGARSNNYRAGKEPLGQEGFVEGGLLPPEIMGPPLVWLASTASDGVTGRRFVARDWDPDLAVEEAARHAEPDTIVWPQII